PFCDAERRADRSADLPHRQARPLRRSEHREPKLESIRSDYESRFLSSSFIRWRTSSRWLSGAAAPSFAGVSFVESAGPPDPPAPQPFSFSICSRRAAVLAVPVASESEAFAMSVSPMAGLNFLRHKRSPIPGD